MVPRRHTRRVLAARLLASAVAAAGASTGTASAAPLVDVTGLPVVGAAAGPAAAPEGEPLGELLPVPGQDPVAHLLDEVVRPVGEQLEPALEPVLAPGAPTAPPASAVAVVADATPAFAGRPQVTFPAGPLKRAAGGELATPQFVAPGPIVPIAARSPVRATPAPDVDGIARPTRATVERERTGRTPPQAPSRPDTRHAPGAGVERDERDLAPPSDRADGMGGPTAAAVLTASIVPRPLPTRIPAPGRRAPARAPPVGDVPTPPG